MLIPPPSRALSARLNARHATAAFALALVASAHGAAAQRTNLVSGPTRQPHRRSSVLACDSAWTGLRELRTPARQRVYVEAPVTVRNAVGTFLIGSPTYVWADASAFVNESSIRHAGDVGVQLLDDSTAVPLPPLPTVRKPYMPIAVGRGAKLLAVWGTSSDTSGSGVWHQDTLWEATLDRGRWTAPRPILTTGEFVWHPGAGSYIADDSSLVLAFPSTDTTRITRRGVTIVMRSRDRWRTRRIDIGGFGPHGIAVAKLAPTELLVMGVGSIERDTIRVLNGVYAVRMSTSDTSSEPRVGVIRDITNGHAEDPAAYSTPQGEHLVWRQPGRQIFADDSLIEATSRDHGRSWAVTSAISLAGDTRGMRVLSPSDDDAEAMALDVRRRVIRTLRRTMDHWTLRPEAFPDAMTIPMIASARDRTTALFGQVRPSTAPDGLLHDAPVLVSTSRLHRCAPPSATPSLKRLRAPPRGKSTLR